MKFTLYLHRNGGMLPSSIVLLIILNTVLPLGPLSCAAAATTDDAKTTGFHLLHCPSIFERYEGIDDQFKKGIQLTKKSTERLMGAIKDKTTAITSEKELKDKEAKEQKSSNSWSSFSFFSSKDNSKNDKKNVNVYNQADGKDLCYLLEDIIETQIQEETEAGSSRLLYHATISITRANEDSLKARAHTTLVRGLARFARFPLLDGIMEMMDKYHWDDRLEIVLLTIRNMIITDGSELTIQHQNQYNDGEED